MRRVDMTFSAAAVPAKKVAAAVAVRMLIRRFNVFHFTARCCAPPRTLPNLKGVPRAALHYFALYKGKYASALNQSVTSPATAAMLTATAIAALTTHKSCTMRRVVESGGAKNPLYGRTRAFPRGSLRAPGQATLRRT